MNRRVSLTAKFSIKGIFIRGKAHELPDKLLYIKMWNHLVCYDLKSSPLYKNIFLYIKLFLFFSFAEIITWMNFTTSFGVYKDTYYVIMEHW